MSQTIKLWFPSLQILLQHQDEELHLFCLLLPQLHQVLFPTLYYTSSSCKSWRFIFIKFGTNFFIVQGACRCHCFIPRWHFYWFSRYDTFICCTRCHNINCRKTVVHFDTGIRKADAIFNVVLFKSQHIVLMKLEIV